MFDLHVQDEEIKKKKRLALAALLALLLGTAAALPLVEVTGVPLAAAPEPTLELPTHTATPVDTPVSSDTPVPPTHAPTQTSAPTITPQPTATPRPTATSTPIPVPPTTTEELPGGAGGGKLEASATPIGAPTVTPTDTPEPPAITPEEPGELPVTGADAGGAGRLALGLTAFSVGVLMLVIGLIMRGGKKSAARKTSETIPPHPTPTEGEELDAPLPQAGTDAGTRVWLALVLAAATLVLVFIAGYTLRRIRRQ
jgi:hypothetical protein